MRFLNWLLSFFFKGGVQGDDDPQGWQAPVSDDKPKGK